MKTMKIRETVINSAFSSFTDFCHAFGGEKFGGVKTQHVRRENISNICWNI